MIGSTSAGENRERSREVGGVTTFLHRFGGTEFRLGRREIGHIHGDYQLDIPLLMEVRNQLVAEKKAQPHHILPNSGWVTFRFNEEKDVEHAIELFKLSYVIAKRSTEKNLGPERDYPVPK